MAEAIKDDSYYNHVLKMKAKDIEMRKIYPDYPPPDELDEMENKYLNHEITEDEYQDFIDRRIKELSNWFKGARKKIEEIFKPYLE